MIYFMIMKYIKQKPLINVLHSVPAEEALVKLLEQQYGISIQQLYLHRDMIGLYILLYQKTEIHL